MENDCLDLKRPLKWSASLFQISDALLRPFQSVAVPAGAHPRTSIFVRTFHRHNPFHQPPTPTLISQPKPKPNSKTKSNLKQSLEVVASTRTYRHARTYTHRHTKALLPLIKFDELIFLKIKIKSYMTSCAGLFSIFHHFFHYHVKTSDSVEPL